MAERPTFRLRDVRFASVGSKIQCLVHKDKQEMQHGHGEDGIIASDGVLGCSVSVTPITLTARLVW